ncbi:MAG: helix-hairpin-helix domain-containing protein [Thermoguttaceae bacterium]|nr:helix-hairpin-helix domain-containing protein [Thermoguttaceae bacterium]MBR0192245.1 helix-hairpin-helix domain-containing protein [Thermoguttaceae bacterium]
MPNHPRKPAKSFNGRREPEEKLPFLAWKSRLAKDPQFMPATKTDQSTMLWCVGGMTVLVLFFLLYCSFSSFSSKDPFSVEKGAAPVYESTAFDVRNQSYLVDINSANEHELRLLPGIGEVMARKIVAERDANGPFQSLEDIERVPGIGKKKRETLEPFLAPIAGSGVLVEQRPAQEPLLNENNS